MESYMILLHCSIYCTLSRPYLLLDGLAWLDHHW